VAVFREKWYRKISSGRKKSRFPAGSDFFDFRAPEEKNRLVFRRETGTTGMRKWLAGAGVAVLIAAASAQERPREADGLYLFISPSTPGLERVAAGLGDRPVRVVFLPADLRAELPEEFLDGVKTLGREFAVVDEEGLALARRFGIRRTPSLVRVHQGHVHVACGSKLNVKEVVECSR
jgi:hypothetical protein